MNLEDLLDSAVNVVFAWRLGMEYVDGEGTSGNGICWRDSVERGELVSLVDVVRSTRKINSHLLRVHGRGCDNEFQITAS